MITRNGRECCACELDERAVGLATDYLDPCNVSVEGEEVVQQIGRVQRLQSIQDIFCCFYLQLEILALARPLNTMPSSLLMAETIYFSEAFHR